MQRHAGKNSRTINAYTWNARNQLAQISQGGSTQLSFSYDALGRRISKTVQGTATQFLYDGNNTVQETQGSAVNPILVGLGVDERFARNDVSGRTYFLTDQINSTIALTDPTGAIKQKYSYDPYGNATPSDTTTGFTNSYQYTGREADTEGLYYYRARYYSPMMGGFISEDPIGFAGGQPSFYGYVNGGPLNNTDSSGLESGRAFCGQGNNSTSAWAGCATPIPECTNPCGCSSKGLLDAIAIATIIAGGGPEDPFTDAIAAEELAAADAVDAAASTVDEAGEGSFFDNTTYSDKVIQQMQGGPGEFHSFPESVTAFEGDGTISTITGGDGSSYEMLEIPGSYTSASGNVYDGTFEFIKDSNGVINHRFFNIHNIR